MRASRTILGHRPRHARSDLGAIDISGSRHHLGFGLHQSESVMQEQGQWRDVMTLLGGQAFPFSSLSLKPCERSLTAIAKRSFNMDTAHQAGIAGLGMYALKLYYDSEESCEGVRAADGRTCAACACTARMVSKQ